MRTEDQVRRKANELLMLKQSLASRLASAAEEEKPAIQRDIDQLEEKIMLLEWVLNKPIGSYHI
ncbi:hypothetical protein [Paenibacillus ginsengihumi]|uniref:hypothetical protein n=1 Tax=Paenibacillus ginsengihumi TaxID=431596 RepID=UPI000381561B|nr:hypothetical protein [Paenibacillus ginsengihumi]